MSNGAQALIVAFRADPPPALAHEMDLRGPIVTEPAQVWRTGKPAANIVQVLATAMRDGTALGAALLPERSLPENAWMAFEWHGALAVDRELGDALGVFAPCWLEQEGYSDRPVRVLLPKSPRRDPSGALAQMPHRVDSPREFRDALLDERPVAVEASADVLLTSAPEWFGELADPRLGGAMALMTLSGAREAGQRFLLRNPAALGLAVVDGAGQAAHASAAGLVNLRAWGFSWGSSEPTDLATRIPRDLLEQALEVPRTSRAAYGVLVEIDASVDPEIELEDGTVLEQASLAGVQTLAAAERRSVNVDAGELRPLVAAAWCLDPDLSPPRGEPVRPTPLKLACRHATQGAVWGERERYLQG